MTMSFNRLTATVLSLAVFSLSTASAEEARAGGPMIYSGEPLSEALYDLAKSAILVSHELSSASALIRTDVFRLEDGRLVAITSRARKLGESYTIEDLRVTASATSRLTKRLPTVGSVKFSK